MRRIIVGGCLVILLAQAVFQGVMARNDSQTTDEAVHVTAGYTYLTKRDFRFNPEHPPLVKILAALPLLALKPNLPADFEEKWNASSNFFYDSWRENRSLGEQFFYGSGNDADLMVFWSRLPIVLLTLLLGLAIFFIALRHFGPLPALVATGFYALDPLVTGHGHLVTTDIALALGSLLTVYTFWQFLRKPSWPWTVGFGLSLGFALLVKHTAIILLPILLVLAVVAWHNKERQTKWQTTLSRFVISLLIVWAMIWATFGFSNRALPPSVSISTEIKLENQRSAEAAKEGVSAVNDEQFQLTKDELTNLGEQISSFDRYYSLARPVLSLLPGDYLKGLFLVIGHASGGHDTFLFGESSKTGWWYYFPALLLLKTPLPTLIGLVGLLLFLLWHRPRHPLVTSTAAAAGLFLLAAMSSKANLGLRHVLPVFPLMLVGVAWAAGEIKKYQIAVPLLLLWLALVFTFAAPNYLGYFNELAGGKEGGYSVATDSNLDWGQDLKRIRNYIAEEKLEKPYVEYGWLGEDSLRYYLGDNYRLLSQGDPRIGEQLIIGATAFNLQQLAPVVSRCGPRQLISSGTFLCTIETD